MITNYTLWRGSKFAKSAGRDLNYEGSIPIVKSSTKKQYWQIPLLLLVLFFTQSISAQTNYYSKATATDFNDVNSWGTATDGTGTTPASISNADNFFVANAAVLSLSGNASVRQLTINAGSLAVSANTLTVSKAGAFFDSSFVINTGGTLNLSGTGTVAVNGNVLFASGSSFNQSGGTISVDGNNGGSTTGSVASGTPLFAIGSTATAYSSGTMSLTGGKIIIVDPVAVAAADYCFFINLSSNALNITAGTNHTLQIGDGVSTDVGGNANGYRLYFWNGTGAFKSGKFVINAPAGTNRHVSQQYRAIYGSDVIVTNGDLRLGSTDYTIAGNVFVDTNGILTATVPITFGDGTYTGSTTITSSPALTAQTVSGPGIYRNATTAPTANFTSVVINNSNTAGVTFSGTSNIATQPTNSISVSGTLNFTVGKINTVASAPFILGASATTAGTLAYTSGGFAPGVTFGRWFGATATGSTITASADATSVTSRYPFVGLNNASRSAWIERVTPVAAGGILGVTYTNVDGYTATALTDGATPLDTKANDSWAVSSLSGTPTAATSFKLNIVAPGIFGGALNTASVRIVKSDNTFVGAHQAGTVTPGGQRITVLPADLTSGSFTLATNVADVPYVSVATGNWNNPTTWNKGTVPTCNDGVFVATGTTVTINSAGNVAKNITINSGGTLVQASGDITIDACTSINNNFVNNNGTLTVTGGTLNINGNLNNATGSAFNQSGGDINVDGNKGAVTASSVASGTNIVSFATDVVSLTGGTLTIVDPHAASSTTSYAFSYSGTAAVNNTTGWTLKFGNGTSTDAGGTTGTAAAAGGFIWNNAGGKIYYSNVVIDGGAGTNRNVYNSSTTIGINNLTINATGELVMATSGIHIGGNFVNNGTFTHTAATLAFQNFQSGTAAASVNPQAISGTGVFRNNLVTASATANVTSVTFNNTNATGITLNVPLSVSGTLTMTSGLINTTNTNLLRLGTATTAGTLSGTPSVTNMVKGPFARTIVSGNANTNYIVFPVGKAAYSPIWLAPATTAVSVMKAEAFDSNTGTFDASLVNMSTTKRWEAPLVSGTITNLNVRLGDASIVSTNIPAQAPTANGIYTGAFGSMATFVAGTPNTIQSGAVILPANYTGFLSFADSNACSGTPVPGNTIASLTSICSGNTVSLSLQNTTSGSGVSYVWESSLDGVAYAPISGATSSSYVATPTVSTYYRAQVTCSGNTATSTAVQVNFANSITATTPGARCGTGTVSLSATPSAGASITWYAAQTGGVSLATGNNFTTPSLAATATYYAGAETVSPATAVLGAGATNSSSVAQSFFPGGWGGTKTQYIIRASELLAAGISAGSLSSLGFEPTTSGETYQGFFVNVGHTTSTTAPTATFISSGLTQVYAGTGANTGFTPVANTVNTLNFGTGAGSSAFVWDGVSNIVVSISWSLVPSASTSTGSTMKVDNVGFVASAYRQRDSVTPAAMLTETAVNTTDSFRPRFTINGQLICSSTRVPVVATVTAAPAFTLSANPAAVCQGQTTAAVTVTAGASDYDTYVWSPATGVSGSAVSGWTFNPTATTIYTLAATNSISGCTSSATVTVAVNRTPGPITVVPDSPTICAGSIQQLAVTGVNVPASIVSGTGASTSGTDSATATLGPNPLQAYYGGTKQQWIYTAAELTALGFAANTQINSIKIDLATANGANALTNLVVKMKNSSTASFATATSWETGLITVKASSSHTPVVGANTFTLDAPFSWNGTDNLVIEMNYSNNNGGSTAAYNTAKYSPTSFVSTIFYRVDTQTAATVNAYVGAASFTYSARTDITFGLVAPAITWTSTGTGDLFTDALATVPYVSGNAAAIVYAKPSANATYTATATLGTCSATDSSLITVSPNTVPNFAAIGSICQGSTAPTLATTSPNGVTGTWAPATVSNTANGSYVFTPSVGQCATTQTLNVTVTPNTVPNFAEIGSICQGSTAPTLATTSPNGVTGTWAPATVSNTANGSYVFTPTAGQCATTQTLNVTVTTQTVPNFAAIGSICQGSTAPTLATTSPNGVTGTWAPATVSNTANGSYVFTPTAGQCATSQTLNVTVTVTPAPTGTAVQDFTTGDTLDDFTVVGTGIIWYDASTGGNVLPGTTLLVSGTFYYASQTVGGCQSISRLSVRAGVNLKVDGFDHANFKYYPNPVSNMLTVSYSEAITGVKLYNMVGQQLMVKAVNSNETQIDMSHLPAGSYLLEVSVGNKSKMVKLLKNQ